MRQSTKTRELKMDARLLEKALDALESRHMSGDLGDLIQRQFIDDQRKWLLTQSLPRMKLEASTPSDATFDALMDAHMDITGAKIVQVIVSPGHGDGKVVHVNVNGVCALRVCRIEEVEVMK